MASVRGERQVQRNLRAAMLRLEAAASPAADAMAEDIAEEYGRRAPRRTGRLAGSAGHRRTGPGRAETAVTAPYASFVEYGTGDTRARPALRASVNNERLTDAAATIMRRAI